MKPGIARRLFKSVAKDSITLKLVSRSSGTLEARPVLTYDTLIIQNVLVSPITEEEQRSDAGLYRDAESRVMFETFDIAERPEFSSAARLDTADRAIVNEIEWEIVSIKNGTVSGLPVTSLFLKRVHEGGI